MPAPPKRPGPPPQTHISREAGVMAGVTRYWGHDVNQVTIAARSGRLFECYVNPSFEPSLFRVGHTVVLQNHNPASPSLNPYLNAQCSRLFARIMAAGVTFYAFHLPEPVKPAQSAKVYPFTAPIRKTQPSQECG